MTDINIDKDKKTELVLLVAAKIMEEEGIEIPDLINKPEVFDRLTKAVEARINSLLLKK